MILTEYPELYDQPVCQLVKNELVHNVVMLPLDEELKVPSDTFEVAYGNCLRTDKNVVFLSCDIMDYDFWHYYEICKNKGRFCFSVNTDLCDLYVYLKTVEFFKIAGWQFSDYWGMLE
jgi:hypothetical protein